LYKENGEIWDPYSEDPDVLHTVLRQVVDAIRYQRNSLGTTDPYGKAVSRLSEAAVRFTSALRQYHHPSRAAPPVRSSV
jgi:hypothetical protein